MELIPRLPMGILDFYVLRIQGWDWRNSFVVSDLKSE
jgi:hypothetical protein